MSYAYLDSSAVDYTHIFSTKKHNSMKILCGSSHSLIEMNCMLNLLQLREHTIHNLSTHIKCLN